MKKRFSRVSWLFFILGGCGGSDENPPRDAGADAVVPMDSPAAEDAPAQVDAPAETDAPATTDAPAGGGLVEWITDPEPVMLDTDTALDYFYQYEVTLP